MTGNLKLITELNLNMYRIFLPLDINNMDD